MFLKSRTNLLLFCIDRKVTKRARPVNTTVTRPGDKNDNASDNSFKSAYKVL